MGPSLGCGGAQFWGLGSPELPLLPEGPSIPGPPRPASPLPPRRGWRPGAWAMAVQQVHGQTEAALLSWYRYYRFCEKLGKMETPVPLSIALEAVSSGTEAGSLTPEPRPWQAELWVLSDSVP